MKELTNSFEFFILFLITGITYEKIYRPWRIKKKIIMHIEKIKGEVIDIERLSDRQAIFNVVYRMNDSLEKATVKFDFFYNQRWY